jgi:hypothetical protein
MKKLIFLFAMVFAVCMAMAQHVDVISQVGDSNEGLIQQAGAQSNYAEILTDGNGNEGFVYQNNNGFGGAGLSAWVAQNGDVNHAFVDQGTTNTTFGHKATIDQDGSYNNADIWQLDGQPSVAYIRQFGDINNADQLIYSDGQGNSSAYIWQEGNSNTALQNLGMGNYVGGSSFSATQVGNGNTSTQLIISDEAFPLGASLQTVNNHGTVLSNGDANIAFQEMGLLLGVNRDNTATITQTGTYNEAYQWQKGMANTSTVFQDGYDNSATSLQN